MTREELMVILEYAIKDSIHGDIEKVDNWSEEYTRVNIRGIHSCAEKILKVLPITFLDADVGDNGRDAVGKTRNKINAHKDGVFLLQARDTVELSDTILYLWELLQQRADSPIYQFDKE